MQPIMIQFSTKVFHLTGVKKGDSMDFKESRAQLSKNITKFRLAAGLTKAQVARKAGISYSCYCKIENNVTQDPYITKLARIAEALNITYSVFFKDC